MRTLGVVEDGQGGICGTVVDGRWYVVENGEVMSPRAERKDSLDEVVGERLEGGIGGEGDLFCRQRKQRSRSACCDIV